MKNSILTTALFSGLICMCFSCSNVTEGITEMDQGKTSISFAAVLIDLNADKAAVKQQQGALPECSDNAPAFVDVMVSLNGEPVAGTLQEPLRLQVSQNEQGTYFTLEDPEFGIRTRNIQPGVLQRS